MSLSEDLILHIYSYLEFADLIRVGRPSKTIAAKIPEFQDKYIKEQLSVLYNYIPDKIMKRAKTSLVAKLARSLSYGLKLENWKWYIFMSHQNGINRSRTHTIAYRASNLFVIQTLQDTWLMKYLGRISDLLDHDQIKLKLILYANSRQSLALLELPFIVRIDSDSLYEQRFHDIELADSLNLRCYKTN